MLALYVFLHQPTPFHPPGVSSYASAGQGRGSLAVVPIHARERRGSRLRESKIDSQARSNESTEARLFLLVVSAKLNLLLLLCWRLPCRRGWGQQLMSALKSFNLI